MNIGRSKELGPFLQSIIPKKNKYSQFIVLTGITIILGEELEILSGFSCKLGSYEVCVSSFF